MNEVHMAQAETPLELPEGQIAVAAFRRRRTAEEHALVVLSMKLPYWLHPFEGRYYLCVESASVEAVAAQLEKYRSERLGWPARALPLSQNAPANPWAIGVFVCILVTFFIAQHYFRHIDRDGMMNTLSLLRGGQWWRPVTALTLHADIGHLAGNLLSGVCFGLLLSRRFGYGVGWLTMFASGILGNLITAWFYFPKQHLSLGASTALYGGLGILVGTAMQQFWSLRTWRAWRQSLLPLAAGLTILGLTGIGQDNIDIFGHIYGFLSGLGLGLVVSGLLGSRILANKWQGLCASGTLLILAFAWLVALR